MGNIFGRHASIEPSRHGFLSAVLTLSPTVEIKGCFGFHMDALFVVPVVKIFNNHLLLNYTHKHRNNKVYGFIK